MRKFTTEELGQIGETELQRLALREQLVANPVKRDVRGYDFVVEFAGNEFIAAPDLAPPTRRVFVQVKASQTKRPSAPIKLSNWQKMVLDPSPWFVLFVQVDGKGDVVGSFIRHVDEILQTHALKALRALSGALHERVLNLSARKRDMVHDRQLRASVEKAVGDWETYSQRKKSFTSSVGYEQNGHLIYVTFERKPNDGHIPQWVDAALGLPVKLEAKRVVTIDNRFSIPIQIDDFGPAILEMTPPGTPGTVRLAPHKGDARLGVTLKTRIFSTASIPAIPEEYASARFECGPLDFFLRSKRSSDGQERTGMSIDTSWHYDRKAPLDQIARAAEALLVLHGQPSTFSYSLEDSVRKESQAIGRLGRIKVTDDKLVELKILSSISALVPHIDLSRIEVSAGELDEHLLQWAMIGRLCSGDPSDVTMGVHLYNEPEAILESQAALILCPKVTIGELEVTLIGAFIGDFELRTEHHNFHLMASATRLFDVHAGRISRGKLAKIVGAAVKDLAAEGLFAIPPSELQDRLN